MTRFAVTRRALVGGLGSIAALAACARGGAEEKKKAAPAAGWHDVAFPASDDQPDGQLAAIYAPDAAKGWPVLVALHGRGEAGRGLDVGAHGWRDDYDLDGRRARLESPPLSAADAGDFLPPERLESINASLAKTPWRGLAVVCPYTPVPTGRDVESVRPFARFVTGPLLEKAAELVGGRVRREATGIDGVSMGGRYALLVGWTRPEVFGAVGALQPAIHEDEADDLAELALTAKKRSAQMVRLVTSEDDPFLEPTRALAAALAKRGVAHRLVVAKGPHDYVWNRGPGSIELLAFHERVLRGVEAP
ncbi:MAG TPA: alpha/beta hydrolase-fold protein [Polyangiaceae bacterium]|nr:alpha/beta hydrolase-fold protein [Polyangiaceae bacterium]